MAKAAASKSVEIKAPRLHVIEFEIVGTAPYVQHRFSQKAIQKIIATQEAGTQARSRRVREAKDFDDVYRQSMYVSKEGWLGMPASAFRNAMISACRTVGYKMTHAKLAAFVLADGYDALDGTPLVRINGTPHRHTSHARNDNGSVDIRVRPMWDEWSAIVRVRHDADMLSESDVANLMMRVGMQVGIGEGRPDSKNSAGLGWGTFALKQEAAEVINAA